MFISIAFALGFITFPAMLALVYVAFLEAS
jgi:hypothetical protein